MNRESKICQNNGQKYCEGGFSIDPEDFLFYEKMKVPPPTFCPKCRLIRRMNNTNERVLYYRTCDKTNKQIMSMFPKEAPFPVYDVDVWYGDSWDAHEYEQEYDFSKPFFEQFKELQNKVPRMALVRQGKAINSEYCHRVDGPKNSYMTFRATEPEECAYLYVGMYTIDCVDCSYITKCELCYECVDCEGCYRTIFSQESVNCRDSAFLYSCYNCSDCIGCVNMRNAQYCIENVQYSKEEYLKKKESLELTRYNGLKAYTERFEEIRKSHPQRATTSLKTTNSSGNWLTNCENTNNSFGCFNAKDLKHCFVIFNAEDCMDFFQWGNKAELVYESENCGIQVSRLFSCSQCWMGAHDLEYCDSCPGAGNCFGCIGLKKGEYSILNKQYSKEEYEALLPKIKEHMQLMPYKGKNNRTYGYGEHFPLEISPFSYNETAGVDFFPMTEEEAHSYGFVWKEKNKNNYTPTLKTLDIPQTIEQTEDSIVNEVIECASKNDSNSVGAFKITDQELLFYKKMNLPIPRECFNIRFLKRFNKRPKLQIIERVCSKCTNKTETVYTKEYAPILYCEKCYQEEVI